MQPVARTLCATSYEPSHPHCHWRSLAARLRRRRSCPRSGALPPLGPLLDPAHGVWATARAALPLGERTIRSRIFEGEVQAVVDGRGVPHIYADDELDAYRALGYLVARDRLFQLELQTRAAAGTLTELVGARALPSIASLAGSVSVASSSAAWPRSTARVGHFAP